MPLPLTLALIATSVLLFVARAVSPGIPVKRYARPASRVDVVLLIVGALGLVLHCVAMFYRGIIAVIPGADGYIRAVNDMGVASIVLYVVPAALVLVALRRQHPLALGIVALTFVAVGITMYNNGPLAVHLVAITVSSVALSVTPALLVRLSPRGPGFRRASANG